jgi:hypothetical protein
MKKVLISVLCIVIALSVFGACAKKDGKETTVKQQTTEEMTTDSAVIKEADAINLIQSYSDKELGLKEDERNHVSFMVASAGVKIEKDNYIEVIATIKVEHKDGDKTTYTFDNRGVYYIRYDGKKVMRKDMDSKEEKYINMKIKAVPSTTAHTHSEEETKDKKDE